MSLAALVLVLASTLLHATWNVWSKDSVDRLAFIWWALVAAIVIYTPLVALVQPLTVPAGAWPILVVSGLAETGYFLALIHAYGQGDLSLVYPIARGSPPLFISAWAGLFLAERLPPLGYAGIGLLVAGICAASLQRPAGTSPLTPRPPLSPPSTGGEGGGEGSAGPHPLPPRWRGGRGGQEERGEPARWALVAGVCISVYSVVDKVGLRYMAAPAYNVWAFVMMALFLAPFAWLTRRRAMWRELKRQSRRVLAGGVVVMGTYFLVLWALERAPVSYVGALRGLSILVGAAFGRAFLHERFGLSRAVGAAFMFSGVVCLSLA
jgi:drug/metabolite transporter (DMT)-like permease